MEEDFDDLGLEDPGGPCDEDWLAEIEASMAGSDGDHPEDLSEEWLQEDLEF